MFIYARVTLYDGHTYDARTGDLTETRDDDNGIYFLFVLVGDILTVYMYI